MILLMMMVIIIIIITFIIRIIMMIMIVILMLFEAYPLTTHNYATTVKSFVPDMPLVVNVHIPQDRC